jgi:hypothetical protein
MDIGDNREVYRAYKKNRARDKSFSWVLLQTFIAEGDIFAVLV